MSQACSEMLDDMSNGMVALIEKKVVMDNDFNGKLG
jgi:hypothetical protein